jgi:hypothetical protein
MTTSLFRRIRTPALASLTTAACVLAVAPSALATFPSRNGLIAFHSETATGTQIFTVRPNGQELRQITHVAGDAIASTGRPTGAASCSRSTPQTPHRSRS